jgi:RNA polymerase sigma factor (sigma-70 family)
LRRVRIPAAARPLKSHQIPKQPIAAPRRSVTLDKRAIRDGLATIGGCPGTGSMSRLQELLRRIREGDEAAAAEFFRTYEPHVRRVVRARLRIAGMRRVSDSSDLCQVVLASFLVGSAVGRYDIEDTEAMKKLLARIAANRVIDLARKPEFRKPAVPVVGPGADGVQPVARGSSPASQIALQELIQKANQLLTDSERPIADLRKEGLTWEEIGQRLGKSADAVRKSLDRAARRIMLALGMEGPNDG